jgi:hypothetical protein
LGTAGGRQMRTCVAVGATRDPVNRESVVAGKRS